MKAVFMKDLCRRYGSRRGIHDVNLEIDVGEIFGFLGPNGAGKSTTIRILMGLLRADSGLAHIFGRDCWTDGPSLRSDIGYVAGDVRLYPWLTVRRALSILSKIRAREIRKIGFELAERFQLEPDLPVRKMSRGNRQKLALVLSLAHSPKLLMLDEPTAGLDPIMQDLLKECLRMMATNGQTVIFSSHTLSDVESLCDHVAILRDGRIVENSTLNVLKAQAPRQLFVTLRPDQSVATVAWPSYVTLVQQPDSKCTSMLRERTCVLELVGTSALFVQWAAAQNFADVVIGPPALDVLFRRYYHSDQRAI